MTTQTIQHPPILLKISPALIISVDVLEPESVRSTLQRLQTEAECSQGSEQVQLHARAFGQLCNACYTLSGALWSRHRAMVHQREGRFAQANEHVERYTADLRTLGVI